MLLVQITGDIIECTYAYLASVVLAAIAIPMHSLLISSTSRFHIQLESAANCVIYYD